MTDMDRGIIKTDRRWRLRYTAEQRAALLAAYDASGLSGTKFTELQGVRYQTFAEWMQQRHRPSAAPLLPAPGGLALVEVRTAVEPRPDEVLLLALPGGVELRVVGHGAIPLAAALIRECGSTN